jgi:hypothetical protein
MSRNQFPLGNGLSTAFVACNPSNRVLTCSSQDGQNWSPDNGIDQASATGPAFAIFQFRYWIAVVADDDTGQILICCSEDGVNWGAGTRVGGCSANAPALAVFDGKLWLGYADSRDGSIYVGSCSDGVTWTSFNPINQSTSKGLALAAFRGRLWVAFIANNSNATVLLSQSSDGLTWSEHISANQQSSSAPALAVFNDALYVAFIADNSSNSVLLCRSSDGLIWSEHISTHQSSRVGPALSAFDGRLYLAFSAANSDGTLLQCRSADGARWSPSTSIQERTRMAPALVGFELNFGTMTPRYMVLNVAYAPPGSASTESTPSWVVYGSGSAMGSTVSTRSAFKHGYSISGGIDRGVFSASADYRAADETATSDSVALSKSTDCLVKINGPGYDGIDNRYDQFCLWLNPRLNVYLDDCGAVRWVLSAVGGTAIETLWVSAKWLLNPAQMPARVREQLDDAGLSTDDYKNILALDPFASGAAFDVDRYQDAGQSFAYAPDAPAQRLALSTPTSRTHAARTQAECEVSAQVGGDKEVSAALTGRFKWTHSAATETDRERTQSADLMVNPPARGYAGPAKVHVYWDRVFHSFVFSFKPLS